MKEKDWIKGANDLRQLALSYIDYIEHDMFVEDHFSEEYVESERKILWEDYPDRLLAERDLPEDLLCLAIAIKYELVHFHEAYVHTGMYLNTTKFEVLEAILRSPRYDSFDLYFCAWERENQIEFVVDLFRTYYSEESQRVESIWDRIPWNTLSKNVLPIFEEDMLTKMDQIFNKDTFNEDGLKLYLRLS